MDLDLDNRYLHLSVSVVNLANLEDKVIEVVVGLLAGVVAMGGTEQPFVGQNRSSTKVVTVAVLARNLIINHAFSCLSSDNPVVIAIHHYGLLFKSSRDFYKNRNVW